MRCTVEQTGIGTARCANNLSNPNGIYVPDPGIEDELLIPNPLCTVLARTDTSVDRDSGCFVTSYYESTLPGFFLDTTFGDGPTIFNLAVGSSTPAAIVEGVAYTHYAEFWVRRLIRMTGLPVFQSTSIDTRIPDSGACRTGGGSPSFCYFPVDSVRVGSRVFN